MTLTSWHPPQGTDIRASGFVDLCVFLNIFNCHNCSKIYRAFVRKTVLTLGPYTWEVPSDLVIGAPSWWRAWWDGSWPHHSRQSEQWLWQKGFIKALGGRGQQPDVTLRFPSCAAWGKDAWLQQWRSDTSNPTQSAISNRSLNLNSH